MEKKLSKVNITNLFNLIQGQNINDYINKKAFELYPDNYLLITYI